jgi:transcriptional regulator with XRE-family HTH domain
MYVIMDRTKSDKLEWIEWIIAQRKKREWSQETLAKKVGTTRQTINDYEQYRRVAHPDEGILSKISEVFGEADDFLVRLGGFLPQQANDDDAWLRKMQAKLRRVPIRNRDAVDKVIESLADSEVEPRKLKKRRSGER